MDFENKSGESPRNYTQTVSALKDDISFGISDVPSDFDAKKKINNGKRSKVMWGLFSEFTSNSTIHGIKYLGEQKRPVFERLFWIFVFGISIYTCSSLIVNIWNKWDQNPVIVSFDEKSTPIWQIPFPAVTICPETKAKQTLFNFTKFYWEYTDNQFNQTDSEDIKYMEAISQICEYHLTSAFIYGNKTVANDMIKIYDETAPEFNETFLLCKWRNSVDDCRSKFVKILTDEGICYTFNSLDASEIFKMESLHDDYIFNVKYEKKSDWSIESGYPKNAGTKTIPERGLGAGARGGLYLSIQGSTTEYDYLCRGPVLGFKILLHMPGEIPQISKHYFRIPFSQEVLMTIQPRIMRTSDGLKHYAPNRRQCYFQKERFLRFFKVYTQNNCKLECLANFTLAKCKCVKFSMPRNEQTPICGALNSQCLFEAERDLSKSEFIEGFLKNRKNTNFQTKCNCLPGCTSIAYDAEISQADLDYTKNMQATLGKIKVGSGIELSQLTIFFKENQFLTSKRSELYGITDFLANCGGLLGLFMGVSTLSFVEIFYFCTIRLISNLRTRSRKLKKLKLAKNEIPDTTDNYIDETDDKSE